MVAHFFKKKVLLNHGFWEVLNIREQDLKGNDDEHDGDGDGDGDDDDVWTETPGRYPKSQQTYQP
jgi:hypothetical protein